MEAPLLLSRSCGGRQGKRPRAQTHVAVTARGALRGTRRSLGSTGCHCCKLTFHRLAHAFPDTSTFCRGTGHLLLHLTCQTQRGCGRFPNPALLPTPLQTWWRPHPRRWAHLPQAPSSATQGSHTLTRGARAARPELRSAQGQALLLLSRVFHDLLVTNTGPQCPALAPGRLCMGGSAGRGPPGRQNLLHLPVEPATETMDSVGSGSRLMSLRPPQL